MVNVTRSVKIYAAIASFSFCMGLNAQYNVAKIESSNSTATIRQDEPIFIQLKALGMDPSKEPYDLVVHEKGYPVRSQLIDRNADGNADHLLVLADYKAAEKKEFWVYQNAEEYRANIFPQKTQAEVSVKVGGKWISGKRAGNKKRGDWEYVGGEFTNLQKLDVPAKHSDHSNYIRYEGAGLESDKVAYRFYLDWRNGFDIFGKTKPDLALHKVGLDGFESYHHMLDWGLDILKVGDALGIGGYGYWDGQKVHRVSDFASETCTIVESGSSYSSLNIKYYGWTVDKYKNDLSATLSMVKGSRLVDVQLKINDEIPNLCTGLVKHEGTEFIHGDLDIPGSAFSYIATWGKQSLNNDNLGMAIIFRKSGASPLKEDEHNHVVVIRPDSLRRVQYYFLAAWEGEPDGIKSKDDFVNYLEDTVTRLTIPNRVDVESSLDVFSKKSPMTSKCALQWSQLMADSEIKTKGKHLAYGGIDLDGTRSARWSYTTGLLMQAYDDLAKAIEEKKYSDFAEDVIGSFIEEDGSIKTYSKDSYNIDNINSGKMLLRLYEETGKEKYKIAADTLREQLKHHPRTSEGGFWHKERYPHQLWLDGVYMGMPFLAQWEQVFNHSEEAHEAVNEFELVRKYCRDDNTGLYFHAWDEKKAQGWADPKTGLSKNFWGRGFGWYSMALVDVLDFIPEENGKDRAILIGMIKDVAATLLKYQDEESGLWYQVLDKPTEPGNYLEATASSMYAYFLSKAYNKGYISGDTFRKTALKSYDGVINRFVEVHTDGTITLTTNCQVAGLGYGRNGTYKYYMSEPVIDNDPKGVGPFIMAGIQISHLLTNSK